MRDLLTDLVRRARRPESTVQPRLASAYEASLQPLQEVVVDRETSTHKPLSTSLRVPTEEHTRPVRTPARRERESPAVTQEMRSAVPVPRSAGDHGNGPAPTATSTSSGGAPRVSAPVTPAPPTGPVSLPVVVIAPAAVPRVPPSDVARRQAQGPVTAPTRPPVRTEVEPLRRVRTDPRRETLADTRERSAPDIRISIGRIEVRASVAERVPARRQPSPASASPLTLDEYLAARARRGPR